MTILAIMNAKTTAVAKAETLPIVQILRRKDALEDIMIQRLVNEHLAKSLLRFWCYSNFEYNRINFDCEGELLRLLLVLLMLLSR